MLVHSGVDGGDFHVYGDTIRRELVVRKRLIETQTMLRIRDSDDNGIQRQGLISLLSYRK